MIKAILFDCFGVLLGNPYKEVLNAFSLENPKGAEELRAIQHASDLGIISRQEDLTYMADILGVSAKDFEAMQDKGEVRNEALIAFIKTLKGKYPLALVSNISSRERLDSRFEPGQLDELFDVVIPSGDVGYMKPEPEIYEIAAQRLGVLPGECVMIDDMSEYCEGARETGMQAIQFITTAQAIADVTTLIDRGE